MTFLLRAQRDSFNTSSIPNLSVSASMPGHPGGDYQVKAFEVERDLEGTIADRFVDDLHHRLGNHGVVIDGFDDCIPRTIGRIESSHTSGVAANTHLYRMLRIDVTVGHQVAGPMSC